MTDSTENYVLDRSQLKSKCLRNLAIFRRGMKRANGDLPGLWVLDFSDAPSAVVAVSHQNLKGKLKTYRLANRLLRRVRPRAFFQLMDVNLRGLDGQKTGDALCVVGFLPDGTHECGYWEYGEGFSTVEKFEWAKNSSAGPGREIGQWKPAKDAWARMFNDRWVRRKLGYRPHVH